MTTWSAAPLSGTDAGAACTFGNPGALATTVTCNDDGVFTLTLTINDGHNAPVPVTTTLTVANANPTVAITTPADLSIVNVGASVSLSANIADAGTNDTHTCSIDWGDATTTPGVVAGGKCTGSHTYSWIGVPTITVTVTDDDSGVGTGSITLTVTDSTVKVTGGGFITSGGRTSFGFVAKNAGAGFAGLVEVLALPGSTVSTAMS